MAQKAPQNTSKEQIFLGGGGGGMPPDPPSKCVLCTHILKFFRASRGNGLSTFNLLPTPLELKTIAKFSVAKIAIPDSSSDTLLSL